MNELIRIHESTKKLRLFTPEDWTRVALQFQGLSKLMGLKDIPPESCKFMIDFVKEEFKDFSFSEIENALKFNLAGKLEEKVQPYGQFNINYLSDVLILYRKKRQKELSKNIKLFQMPEKTQEEKDNELKQVMDEVFDELNDHYKNKVTSFSFINGVKYYGCLKYFSMMPNYKEKQRKTADDLWVNAKKATSDSYMGSLDSESRKIIAYLKDSKTPISDELLSKVQVATTNNYKGLLVTHCLNEFKEVYDDLIEAK